MLKFVYGGEIRDSFSLEMVKSGRERFSINLITDYTHRMTPRSYLGAGSIKVVVSK